VTFTAQDVQRWMENAGGRVVNDAACAEVAEAVSDLQLAREALAQMRADDDAAMKAFASAHDAVNMLRKALPTVIARLARSAGNPSILTGQKGGDRAAVTLARCMKMWAALADVPPRPRKIAGLDDRKMVLPFLHHMAGLIADRPPTQNTEGFAVRFVHAALRELGNPTTPDAIAQELKRASRRRRDKLNRVKLSVEGPARAV
jgi:hypothetical protein